MSSAGLPQREMVLQLSRIDSHLPSPSLHLRKMEIMHSQTSRASKLTPPPLTGMTTR